MAMGEFDAGSVRPGDFVVVRDAHGAEITMRALTGLHHGRSFPIIRVCKVEDWPPDNDDDKGIPWPAEAVLGRVGLSAGEGRRDGQ